MATTIDVGKILEAFGTDLKTVSKQMNLSTTLLKDAVKILNKEFVNDAKSLTEAVKKHKDTSGLYGLLGKHIKEISKPLSEIVQKKYFQQIEKGLEKGTISQQKALEMFRDYQDKVKETVGSLEISLKKVNKDLIDIHKEFQIFPKELAEMPDELKEQFLSAHSDFTASLKQQFINGKLSSEEVIDQYKEWSKSIMTDLNSSFEEFQEVNRKFMKISESTGEIIDEIIGPLQRILTRIPILGGLLNKVIEPAKEKLTSMLANRVQNVGQSLKGISSITKVGIAVPAAIAVLVIAGISHVFGQITKLSESISNTIGSTFSKTEKITKNILTTYRQTTAFGIELDSIEQTAIALMDVLSAMNMNRNLIENTVKAAKSFSLSEQEAAQFQSVINNLMRVSIRDSKSQEEIYVAIVEQSEKLNISTNSIAKGLIDSKNAASSLLLISKQQRREFIEQVAKAKKLGTTLDDLKRAFSIFGDLIEATRATMAISQATGVYLDARKLFLMSLHGDIAGITENVVDKLLELRNKVTDPVQYNVFMRVITRQLNLSEEMINELLEKRLRMREEESKRLKGQISFTERLKDINKSLGLDEKVGPFQRMWKDIKQMVQPALESLQEPAARFVSIIFNFWKVIKPIVSAIFQVITLIIKVITPFIDLLSQFMSLIGGTAQSINSLSPAVVYGGYNERINQFGGMNSVLEQEKFDRIMDIMSQKENVPAPGDINLTSNSNIILDGKVIARNLAVQSLKNTNS